ncbi:MAG: rod shape-determining protein MreD [candidate division Zixibacteria bacterium]
MTRYLPFLLYLLLIAMHEVMWRDITALYLIAMNLPAMMVVIVAIYKSELTAAWFGFLAGIVLSAGQPESMGWQGLLLAAIGISVFYVREKLNLESVYSKLLLIISAVFLHNLLSVVINDVNRILYLTWSYCLPSAVYSSLIAWVFFLFKERKLTSEKIKAVF